MQTASTVIQPIAANETLALRREVLRPERPLAESIFAGDDAPATQHWGVFAADQLIAVASLFQEAAPGMTADSDAWRLRGMAVSPVWQRRGYGGQLLCRCLQAVAEAGGQLLWCNARSTAVGFYRAAGFEIVGDEFVIPGIGPHYVMWKSLAH